MLSIQGLKTYFFTRSGIARAVDDVSLEVRPGETLGIVGESGSGKSVTFLSVLRLVPPPGKTVSGEIIFEGQDLLQMPLQKLRNIRGKRIGIVFQDPMTSLNPFLRIGDQVAETLLVHEKISRNKALDRAVGILEKVGISDAASRLEDYPHRFSGGMRQRVMIASALIANPSLLIADEPTTALDVTIQAQVLDLFTHIKSEFSTAIVLITHNLGIVAGMADHAAVMYSGRVVEYAKTTDLFAHPRHPYTLALLKTLPRPGDMQPSVQPIPGMPPDLTCLPRGCSFFDRCAFRMDRCLEESPPLISFGPGHQASCWVDIEKGQNPVSE
ncbi:MAG: peptide ABC transporter ATP-binding protein [Acidobacteria bacterium RIFCSPLOWO2_12_FULL_54_10]|nr:MAG: peptide ABC transporter ATP-binding protein [Acidobacteria bacterium RIFCSPLOWO2_12_FULL_54_10]